METRWGQRSNLNNSRENSRRRSMKQKPPRCSWQPTVPAWEKTFCKVVGALDWQKILDMKKFTHLYENVVKWNDSAGEEAFHNAKKRFLAEMQGVPCDVSLPNPDLYIDEVDWDSGVDPELLLDLDREFTAPDATENHETVVIFGDSLYRNKGFTGAGWGEDEEIFKKANDSSSKNLGNSWEGYLSKTKQTANDDGWGDAANDDGWGEAANDDGWGKAANVDGWGEAANDDGWGEAANVDGWGNSANDDGWGEAANVDGWGNAVNDYGWGEAANVDGWGNTANDNGWGEAVPPLHEGVGTFGDTGWGEAVPPPHDDNGWGEAVPPLHEGGGTFEVTGWGEAVPPPLDDNGWGEAVPPLHEGGGTFGDTGWEEAVPPPLDDNGWGEAVPPLHEAGGTFGDTGWGEAVPPPHEGGGTVGGAGWGDSWDTSWFSDQYNYNETESKVVKGADNGITDAWDFNSTKREYAGGFAARNNISRFHGNDHKASQKWRNGKARKKETFVYENSTTGKKLPSRSWKPMNSCGPLSYNNNTSGEAGQTWKRVL